MSTFDYEQLDPGIRAAVRYLRERAYDTTDSGDGVTKLADGWPSEELILCPHVAIHACRDTFVSVSHRLLFDLEQPAARDAGLPTGTPSIEATYFPASGSAIVLVTWPA